MPSTLVIPFLEWYSDAESATNACKDNGIVEENAEKCSLDSVIQEIQAGRVDSTQPTWNSLSFWN